MPAFCHRLRFLAVLAAAALVAAATIMLPAALPAQAAGGPTVTVNQAASQADPTMTSPVVFDVEFSEPVTGFVDSDVTMSGTAGPGGIAVTGSGASYSVQIVGMTQSGTVILTIPAGAATAVAAPMSPSEASTSEDNVVTYNRAHPIPTETINIAGSQADPTFTSPVVYDVVFSEPVTGFTGSDAILSGSANPTTAVVTGSGTTYQLSVSGMNHSGQVRATIPAGAADAVAAPQNPCSSSTSVHNTVSYFLPGSAPTVTIDQSAGQVDPASAGPIEFDVVFSEGVNGFTGTDVVLSGTAGATSASATDSGDGRHFTVAVTGMTTSGTVIATVPSGVATSMSQGAPNGAATSTDAQVTYDSATTSTADPTRTDQPAPSTTGHGAAGTDHGDPSGAVEGIAAGTLPFTGSQPLPLLVTALVLGAAGVGLIAMTRRQRPRRH